MAVKA